MEIIKLNLIPNGVNPTCHAKQYDEGRVIRFELFDGLTPYTLQSGDTVTLNLRKPDNTIIETSVTATQGNKYVDLVTTEQMCACVGYNLGTFKIANGSVDIGTLNFIMAVERDVLADGIPSQSVIEDLDALVEEAVGDNFYNKSETDALLDAKADKSTTYTKTETDTLLNTKANSSDVYTKQEVDTNIEKIAVDIIGKNLDNPLTETEGYYLNASGGLYANSEYNVSDYIEIEEGESYSVGVYRNDNNALYQTRTLYAFFDSNKAIIGTTTNVDNTSGLLAVAPVGAKYIRISGRVKIGIYNCNLMLVKSERILLWFIPYTVTTTIVADIPDLDMLLPLKNSSAYKTKNLYNPDTTIEGYLNSAGNIAPSPSGTHYSTSDLIDVKPNTDYYVYGFGANYNRGKTRLIAACYENGVFVASTYVNTEAASYIVINSGIFNQIRVSAIAERGGRHLMVSEGEISPVFCEYDLKQYTTLNVESDKLPEKPVLSGKKWVVCGDSFTEGDGIVELLSSGIYKGRKSTYPWLIGNRNNIDIIQFFQGGQTLAYPADETFHNSLTDPNANYYYQNIPADADYITFYLGINDEHHATGGGDGEDPTGLIPLGTIDDNTTATYYGAWNVVLTWLISNRPNAHIGIIITNGLTLVGYRTAQLEIARKYSIPYIDLNGDERTPAMLRTVNEYIPALIKRALVEKWAVDPTGASGAVNTHPNENAHKFESAFIESFLRSI